MSDLPTERRLYDVTFNLTNNHMVHPEIDPSTNSITFHRFHHKLFGLAGLAEHINSRDRRYMPSGEVGVAIGHRTFTKEANISDDDVVRILRHVASSVFHHKCLGKEAVQTLPLWPPEGEKNEPKG